MLKPNIITAQYRVVSPLFIGDAKQRPDSGIRPASIKGALRFWWRALNWGRFYTEKKNEEAALRALHKEEARLFGAAMDGKKQGGQGCFLLSVEQTDRHKTLDNWPLKTDASYLAYGLLKTTDVPHRTAIKEGSLFTLKLVLKKSANESDIKALKQTLSTWSLFSGLGSRSRRAMGAITLIALNGENKQVSKAGYEQQIIDLLAAYKNIPLAPFTAFSQESAYRLIETNKDVRHLLDLLGTKYKEYRNDLRGADKMPLGLPLTKVSDNRRASPVFFHAHYLENKSHITSLLYLPSRIFHPEERNISMQAAKKFVTGENQ